MPKLHDARVDFSAGRTNKALASRPDTRAYRSSLYDALNCMVTTDNSLHRRWGSFDRFGLAGWSRLETWEYAASDTARFILIFSNGNLDIYDMTLSLRHSDNAAPWDADGARYLSFAAQGERMVITDQSFATQILTFDPSAGTFSMADFAFTESEDGTRLHAPFYQFAPDSITFTTTMWLSAGSSTGLKTHIEQAYTGIGGSLTAGDFSAGTGTLTASAAFFTAAMVGTRMRLEEGEFEITGYTSATVVSITVKNDIATRLDTNPFFTRKGSNRIEVAAFDHNLSVGDNVFFSGLSSADASMTAIDGAVGISTSGSAVTAPSSGTAKAYAVKKVIDADAFEIEIAGTTPTLDELVGGADVLMWKMGAMTKIKEPAFSGVRGWPQACVLHETRLWLGGFESLPDAIFGSVVGTVTNFDPDTGAAPDAVLLYGIGEQSRVRHLVSTFDLIILTDNGEYYVPGNADQVISQETVRSIPATGYGASYTDPVVFDGGVFFVDGVGQHIRELKVQNGEVDYSAYPSTVTISDWVKQPDDVTIYKGSADLVTSYAIWTNDTDGSLMVLHSNRADNAFGFMRWALDSGTFVSVTGVHNRLFFVANFGGSYRLCEFDTSADFITVDRAATLTSGSPTTAWTSALHAGLTCQTEFEGYYGDAIVPDGSGNFSTAEAASTVTIGLPMPWSATLQGPVAESGQGPKMGKTQRLVSAEIDWRGMLWAEINGDDAMAAEDMPVGEAPTPVEEWREYFVGEWGRSPRLALSGSLPGRMSAAAAVLNVYF